MKKIFLFALLATHQFALSETCYFNIEDAKLNPIYMYGLSDIALQPIKKIEVTTQCAENAQFNTKCSNSNNYKNKAAYTFDDNQRLKTFSGLAGEINYFEYEGESKYPFKIVSGRDKINEEQKIIKRDSNNLPISENLKWSTFNDIIMSHSKPREVFPQSDAPGTIPGEIKSYYKEILQSIKYYYYDQSKTESYNCLRRTDEFGNTIIDTVHEQNSKEIKQRTIINKKGDRILSITNDNLFIHRTSYSYKEFDKKGNWIKREICQYKLSSDKVNFCEEEIRSIEYK